MPLDMEVFWLGRVPCRTVRLVGLVVGVQVWEKRTVYTIDDGTGVVDCAVFHPQAAPPSPAKLKYKSAAARSNTVAPSLTRPSFSDYLLSARKSDSHALQKKCALEPSPTPKPVAHVGQLIRITGRVVSKGDYRMLLVDEIGEVFVPRVTDMSLKLLP